jgi:DNA polymerase I-like protein with 3'-5' exonuclease and polymerase domains
VKGFPSYHARTVMGGVPTYYTSGKLFNNCCQGIARDVFAEKITEIEYKLGLPVCLTVHDEVLVEVDAADAQDAQREVSRVMATAPEWIPEIPLSSDCNIMQAYEK